MERKEYTKVKTVGVKRGWSENTLVYLGAITHGQYSCLENPRDGGAWWAAVSGVAQSQTRLKRLSSSCSITFIFVNYK